MEPVRPRRDQDERATLVDTLDFYRSIILHKTEGLDRDQLNTTLQPSSLTLAGLLKHLAHVEDSWITDRLTSGVMPDPWASAPFETDEDWDFHSAPNDTPDALRALYSAACQRSRVAISALELGSFAPNPDFYGNRYNVRWVLLHLIEETARHAGHADLIRESIDGAVGD
jgi:uncharacterized damage-inducible protein DinB